MNLKCKNCLQAIFVDNTGHWASSVATGGRTCAKGDTAIGKHRLHEPDHPPRVIPCPRCRSALCETVVCDNSVPLHTAIRKCAERSAKRADAEHALAAQFAREVEVAESKVIRLRAAMEAHCASFESSGQPGFALLVADLREALNEVTK